MAVKECKLLLKDRELRRSAAEICSRMEDCRRGASYMMTPTQVCRGDSSSEAARGSWAMLIGAVLDRVQRCSRGAGAGTPARSIRASSYVGHRVLHSSSVIQQSGMGVLYEYVV